MSSRKGAEAGAGSGEKILEPELPQKRTASNPPNTRIYVYWIKKNLPSPHTVLSRDRSNFRTAGSSGLFFISRIWSFKHRICAPTLPDSPHCHSRQACPRRGWCCWTPRPSSRTDTRTAAARQWWGTRSQHSGLAYSQGIEGMIRGKGLMLDIIYKIGGETAGMMKITLLFVRMKKYWRRKNFLDPDVNNGLYIKLSSKSLRNTQT